MGTTKDWRDDVFVSTLCYIFQGALFCEECGDKIKTRLSSKGDTGDSNDYPQGPYNDGGGPADSPQFCDNGKACVNKALVPSGTAIGCPLGNPLTRYGAKEINDTVRSLALAENAHARAVARLYALLYGPKGHNVLTDEVVEIQFAKLTELPPPLRRALEDTKHARNVVPGNRLYVSSEAIYYTCVSYGIELIVGRFMLKPDGSYGKPYLLRLPASEQAERSDSEIIRTCIEDAAWD